MVRKWVVGHVLEEQNQLPVVVFAVAEIVVFVERRTLIAVEAGSFELAVVVAIAAAEKENVVVAVLGVPQLPSSLPC